MRAIVISIDAELALGYHDIRDVSQAESEAFRHAWSWLVDRLEAAAIPCTWAVVGHLCLDGCDGVHADHPSTDGWFDADPGGDESSAPGWFGRSLVQSVDESAVDHEIGSHTFSHVLFDDPDMTRAIARSEVERSLAIADRCGYAIDSFVFPRNRVGYLDILAEYGITAYRSRRAARWFDGTGIRPVGKALSYTVGSSSPPISEPEVTDHGLVDIPASLYLFDFEGIAKRVAMTVTDDPVVRKVRHGLAELDRRDDGVLHLWFHPNNLTDGMNVERMDRVLDLVDRFRRERDVPVMTMREVAAEVRR